MALHHFSMCTVFRWVKALKAGKLIVKDDRWSRDLHCQIRGPFLFSNIFMLQYPMIVQADSEDPDLTKQKHCMIWVFTVCMRQGLFPCYSSFFFLALGNRYEPEHDKTYRKTCAAGKDSDQPVCSLSLTRVLVHPSLESPDTVEGTCDQQRLWSDCADAQSDLSLLVAQVLL